MRGKNPPIVFLDRDGVINEFPGMGNYVISEQGLRIIPGALQGIQLLTAAGCELHVVSNQGCVSRGLISRKGLDKLTANMLERVTAAGGRIQGVHYCVHQTTDDCECKKPKTALFLGALQGRPVDKASVFFIGDSEEDILAGKNLGCGTVLVLTGRVQPQGISALAAQPDTVKRDLLEAAQWLLEKKR